MQTNLIREKHIKWLKENFKLTFKDVEAMNDKEIDNFLVQLALKEADCVETEEEELSSEVVDIICGPY